MKLGTAEANPEPQLQGHVVQTHASPEGVTTLPKTIHPNAQWRYKAHTARWDWNEDYGWHPVLGRWHLDNGLDGITINKKGYQGLGVSRQRHLDRNWIIIELGDHRLGKFANYLQAFPTVKGRPFHISIFHQPEIEGKIVEWVFNKALYKEFLETIVEKGVIPPMRKMIRNSKIRKQQRIVDKLEQDMFETPNNPMLRVRYEREARKLAGMKGEDIGIAVEEARGMVKQATQKLRADHAKQQEKDAELAALTQPSPEWEALVQEEPTVCERCGRQFETPHGLKVHASKCKGGQDE